MAWFKDDNSLSNSNLLNRWNLIKAERNRLLEEQQASTDEYMKSDEQISHEKFHEQCNFEKDAIIPLLPANSPLSSPASTTKGDDSRSTPGFYGRGFHVQNEGWPGNQGIDESKYPVPDHRPAPISQKIFTRPAETQTRRPYSEVQMLRDTKQRSHFWGAISSNNQDQPHHCEATNNNRDQRSRSLYNSQVNASINPTHALSDSHQGSEANAPVDLTCASPYGRQDSQTRASLNSESASQYSNAPINSKCTFSHGSHGPHTLHGPHTSYGPHASHASHGSHGSPGSQASDSSNASHATHASHASHDNQSVNPRDAFYYGSYANASTTPINEYPYVPHSSRSAMFRYGSPGSEANPTYVFPHGSHGSEANAFINPAYNFPYGSRGSQVHAPIDPAAAFRYGSHGSEVNVLMNSTYAFPYGSHGPQVNAPINSAYTSSYGHQAPEAVAPTDPTNSFPYGSQGSQANGPIDPRYVFPYSYQGSEANARNHPTFPFPYGSQGSEVNASIRPACAFPNGRQGSEAYVSMTPEYLSTYNRQGIGANVSMNPTYPLPYGRQGLEANASLNPAYPLPYGRQGLEANSTINPAYPFSYSRQVSGPNASIYPPPIPPTHNPEQMDRQKIWIPRLCSKCDKPWHGFGPCFVESVDQQEGPKIPARAAETGPQSKSLPSSPLTIRCGICGEPWHSRTRCPKDPARKKVPAFGGQKVDKCENCGRYGHKAERCGNRYLEFWERACTKAKLEDDLAAATQEPITKSAPEPKDGGDCVDEGK